MSLERVLLYLSLITALAAVLALLRTKLLPWTRDLARDIRAGRDALVGRPAVVDSITGTELAPELPGVGVRMARVEDALVLIADQKGRTDELEHTVTVLRGDVTTLQEQVAALATA